MKKILIILFSLFALTVLFNNEVFCEEGTIYTENYFQYIINEDNDITIVKYYGNDVNVTVPRTIGTYTVTIIADEAFEDTNVEIIRIPDTIISIYDTSISDMKVSYYDVFGKDIKEEKGADVIVPEPKESETKSNTEGAVIQIEEKDDKDIKSNTTTAESSNAEIDETGESFKIINDEENITLKEIQKTNNTVRSDNGLIIASCVFIFIVIAIIVVLMIKKKNNNKKS